MRLPVLLITRNQSDPCNFDYVAELANEREIKIYGSKEAKAELLCRNPTLWFVALVPGMEFAVGEVRVTALKANHFWFRQRGGCLLTLGQGVRNREAVFEGSINMNLRFLFLITSDGYALLRVGQYDILKKD